MDAIYDDLDDYQHVGELEELREENIQLKKCITEMERKMSKLTEENTILMERFGNIERAFAALLSTARAEIQRKTDMVATLNQEKDQLIFRHIGNRDPPSRQEFQPKQEERRSTKRKRDPQSRADSKVPRLVEQATDENRLPEAPSESDRLAAPKTAETPKLGLESNETHTCTQTVAHTVDKTNEEPPYVQKEEKRKTEEASTTKPQSRPHTDTTDRLETESRGGYRSRQEDEHRNRPSSREHEFFKGRPSRFLKSRSRERGHRGRHKSRGREYNRWRRSPSVDRYRSERRFRRERSRPRSPDRSRPRSRAASRETGRELSDGDTTSYLVRLEEQYAMHPGAITENNLFEETRDHYHNEPLRSARAEHHDENAMDVRMCQSPDSVDARGTDSTLRTVNYHDKGSLTPFDDPRLYHQAYFKTEFIQLNKMVKISNSQELDKALTLNIRRKANIELRIPPWHMLEPAPNAQSKKTFRDEEMKDIYDDIDVDKNNSRESGELDDSISEFLQKYNAENKPTNKTAPLNTLKPKKCDEPSIKDENTSKLSPVLAENLNTLKSEETSSSAEMRNTAEETKKERKANVDENSFKKFRIPRLKKSARNTDIDAFTATNSYQPHVSNPDKSKDSTSTKSEKPVKKYAELITLSTCVSIKSSSSVRGHSKSSPMDVNKSSESQNEKTCLREKVHRQFQDTRTETKQTEDDLLTKPTDDSTRIESVIDSNVKSSTSKDKICEEIELSPKSLKKSVKIESKVNKLRGDSKEPKSISKSEGLPDEIGRENNSNEKDSKSKDGEHHTKCKDEKLHNKRKKNEPDRKSKKIEGDSKNVQINHIERKQIDSSDSGKRKTYNSESRSSNENILSTSESSQNVKDKHEKDNILKVMLSKEGDSMKCNSAETKSARTTKIGEDCMIDTDKYFIKDVVHSKEKRSSSKQSKLFDKKKRTPLKYSSTGEEINSNSDDKLKKKSSDDEIQSIFGEGNLITPENLQQVDAEIRKMERKENSRVPEKCKKSFEIIENKSSLCLILKSKTTFVPKNNAVEQHVNSKTIAAGAVVEQEKVIEDKKEEEKWSKNGKKKTSNLEERKGRTDISKHNDGTNELDSSQIENRFRSKNDVISVDLESTDLCPIVTTVEATVTSHIKDSTETYKNNSCSDMPLIIDIPAQEVPEMKEPVNNDLLQRARSRFDGAFTTSTPNPIRFPTLEPSNTKALCLPSPIIEDTVDSMVPSSERLDSMAPESERLDSMAPSSERLDSTAPASERLDSMTPGSERLESTAPGSERLDSMARGSKRLDSMAPGSELLDSIAPKSELLDSMAPRSERFDTNEGSSSSVRTDASESVKRQFVICRRRRVIFSKK